MGKLKILHLDHFFKYFSSFQRCFKILILCSVFFNSCENALEPKETKGPKQLVITEVNLDSKSQECWIEIFNPSENPLVLSGMWISGIRTPTLLPREYEGQKEIEFKGGERIIICSDIKSFKSIYGVQIRTAELNPLKSIFNGGYITINHMTEANNNKNVVRIGPPEYSHNVESIAKEVLGIDSISINYQRELLKGDLVSPWSKATPTPGK